MLETHTLGWNGLGLKSWSASSARFSRIAIA